MASSRLRPFFLLCVFVPALGFLAWADFDALQSARLAGNPALFMPLGLASDRSGADWKLTWNPDAVPLAGAAAAELVIEDGNHENRILLSRAQIRSGSIVYSPFTDDICFRLHAYDGDRRSASETLRVLDSQPQSEPANSPKAGYAERSSLGQRHRPAVARNVPGTVIFRAATLRGTSGSAPPLGRAAHRMALPAVAFRE